MDSDRGCVGASSTPWYGSAQNRNWSVLVDNVEGIPEPVREMARTAHQVPAAVWRMITRSWSFDQKFLLATMRKIRTQQERLEFVRSVDRAVTDDSAMHSLLALLCLTDDMIDSIIDLFDQETLQVLKVLDAHSA